MKIYSDDGQEFKSVNECNAYEANQKLLKQKEETERKIKEEKIKDIYDKITNKSKELDDLLYEYETLSEKRYYYSFTGKEYDFPMLLNEFVNRMIRE